MFVIITLGEKKDGESLILNKEKRKGNIHTHTHSKSKNYKADFKGKKIERKQK